MDAADPARVAEKPEDASQGAATAGEFAFEPPQVGLTAHQDHNKENLSSAVMPSTGGSCERLSDHSTTPQPAQPENIVFDFSKLSI